MAQPIPYGTVCPWPQNLRRRDRKKHRNRIRVRVHSFLDSRVVLRNVSVNTARAMCAEDSQGNRIEGIKPVAYRISRKKADLTDIRLLAPERGEKTSPCTLTMGDMIANGEGSADGELRRRGNNIDRAMSKVEAWPLVFDEKNVSVCAGRVINPTVLETGKL